MSKIFETAPVPYTTLRVDTHQEHGELFWTFTIQTSGGAVLDTVLTSHEVQKLREALEDR